MAWIQVRNDLPDDTRILRMAHALKCDTERVMGCFIKLWILADKHTLNGRLGIPAAVVDEHVHLPGFAEAAKAVDWLGEKDEGCFIPRFGEKNGESHKARLLKSARQGRWRKGKGASTDVDGGPSTQAPPARLPEQEQEQAKEQELNPALQASRNAESKSAGISLAARPPAQEVVTIMRKLWPRNHEKAYRIAQHPNASIERACWMADRIIREKPARAAGFMEKAITEGWDVPPEWVGRFHKARGDTNGTLRIAGGAA